MRKTIMVAAAAAASLTVLGGVAVASIPGPDGSSTAAGRTAPAISE